MLIARLDVDAEDALARLRAYAFRSDSDLTVAAQRVLDHMVYLEP